MTTPVFANSATVQPAQGGEVACCSIVGGPFAAIDAYVSGGTPGVQLEFRLYATVGTLRTRVAIASYAGPPVGAAGQGTLLKWTVVGQPLALSPIVAGGTVYDLVVFGMSGNGTRILATLAGTNSYDTSISQSGTAAVPSNYGSTTVTTNVGCAQLCDVGVDEANLNSCAFDVLASCGAGSVEALVATAMSGGPDGKANVIREISVPVATQYRLAVRNIDGSRQSGNVTASLATYNSTVVGPPQISPGTVPQALFTVSPGKTSWLSPGFSNVQAFGAKGDGVTDDSAAFAAALAFAATIHGNVLVPATADFYRLSTDLTIPSGIGLIGENSQPSNATQSSSFIRFDAGFGVLIPDSSSGTIFEHLTFKSLSLANVEPLIRFGNNVSFVSIVDCHFFSNGVNNCIQMGTSVSPVEVDPCSFTDCNFFAGAAQAIPLIQGFGIGGGFNNISFERCQFTGDLNATVELVRFAATDNGLLTNINFSRCLFEVPIAGAVVFVSVQRSGFYNTWTGDLSGHLNTAPLFTLKKGAFGGALNISEIIFNILQTDIGQNVAGLETINADVGSRNVVCIGCFIESINNGGPGGGAAPITCINCNVGFVIGDPVVGIDANGVLRSQDVEIVEGSPEVLVARLGSNGALGGLWFGIYAATKDGNNYALLQTSAVLQRVNGPAGGQLSLRVGDTDYLNLDQAAGLVRERRLPFWFDMTPSAAPAAPASGFIWFIDVADNKLKIIGAGGTTTIIAIP